MAACNYSMLDYRRRSKEEAQRPELDSLGKNCVLIRVSSLTQVRLKLGYLAWVPLWVWVLLWSAVWCGVCEQGNKGKQEQRDEWRGWISRSQAIGCPSLCRWRCVHLCSVSLRKSWDQGYLALTSFIGMTVIYWQAASVFGGMLVNDLAPSDSVAAVSGHVALHWLQGTPLLGSELDILRLSVCLESEARILKKGKKINVRAAFSSRGCFTLKEQSMQSVKWKSALIQDWIVYEVSKVGSLEWWQQLHRVPDSTLTCPFPLLLISRSAINWHPM